MLKQTRFGGQGSREEGTREYSILIFEGRDGAQHGEDEDIYMLEVGVELAGSGFADNMGSGVGCRR